MTRCQRKLNEKYFLYTLTTRCTCDKIRIERKKKKEDAFGTRKEAEGMNTSQKELDARELLEQLNRLPEAARIRVGYIIQGAALVAGNHSPQEPDPERNDPAA